MDHPSNKEFLAAIVDSSDDAIIGKDLDGIIRSFNPAAERIFGYASHEVIGHSIKILIPPERLMEEKEILVQISAGKRVQHFETQRITKDGRRLDISLSISPIRDSSGVIVGASKIARDITEQKRLARELAAQQEWFRITLGSIGDAVIACDQSNQISFMNSKAEQLTGWKLADAKTRPLQEVFHIINEKTRQPVDNPAEQVIRSGLTVGMANHTLLIDRTGKEYPIEDSAAPIFDDEGKILGVVLVFHDVTEQRAAQDALAEQREWLETTLESIGDAVIATDVCGKVVFMNPIAENLTGWRMEEARGVQCSTIFQIINEYTRGTVESPVTRVLNEGMVVGLANHTILIAKDGVERAIDDSGAPIRGRDGRIVGVVLVFRDVSDRRQNEIEKQNASAERERLLQNERLARSEAEQANRVKDDFVAIISHELRTPLNAILGWTQLLQKKYPNDPGYQQGLEIVIRNTRVQAQLISDLLDISRIVSGKLKLDFETIELASVIKESVETLRQLVNERELDVEVKLDEKSCLVAADHARLQQIFWNLLSNSIKFTPKGGKITVTLENVGTRAKIVISDTGEGIRPELLPVLFDKFRAVGATTRRHGGLGLGLSIVKNLVELHGGVVSAWSEGPGRGAVFTIELPVTKSQPTQKSVETTHSSGPVIIDDISLRGLNVLVVEDETDARELVRNILEEHGAQVITAASAAETLDLLKSFAPDMIISDIGLPNVDGYELMQNIRKLGGQLVRVPAIALTAFARPEDRTRTLNAGFQVHLPKPFEPSELVVTVARLADLLVREKS